MRLAPVPMFYARDPAEAMEKSGLSSKTTHALPIVVDACRYFGGLIVGTLNGAPRDELLSPRYTPIPHYWQDHALHEEIDAVAAGSFLRKEPHEIQGMGYVVRCWKTHSGHFGRAIHLKKDVCL